MTTFTRIKEYGTRVAYELSETLTTIDVPEFRHVVISRGTAGDTCAFPSNEEGHVLSFLGFGYEMGPSRWLFDDELDGYLTACIAAYKAGSKRWAPDNLELVTV